MSGLEIKRNHAAGNQPKTIQFLFDFLKISKPIARETVTAKKVLRAPKKGLSRWYDPCIHRARATLFLPRVYFPVRPPKYHDRCAIRRAGQVSDPLLLQQFRWFRRLGPDYPTLLGSGNASRRAG